jgi:hypothetical protein
MKKVKPMSEYHAAYLAQREVAHRLIDIGFKVLAKKLHPDLPNGDAIAMARLNKVRDQLKHSI